MVLYPEDETHSNCIQRLQENGYTFACILHDKDTYENGESDEHAEGELKKAHWHVVLRMTNPRFREPLANELGIAPNYIEPCRNRDSALLYLVHDGLPNKYQYDVNDVFGPLVPNLQKLLVDDDEGQRVKSIINIIDTIPRRVTYREILLLACDNGLYGDFRRIGSGIKWLLDEHNSQFESPYDRQQYIADKDRFRDFQKVKGGG